jgi:hypothetical protein
MVSIKRDYIYQNNNIIIVCLSDGSKLASVSMCEYPWGDRLPHCRQETKAIRAGNQTVFRSQADIRGTESTAGKAANK